MENKVIRLEIANDVETLINKPDEQDQNNNSKKKRKYRTGRS